MRTILLTALIGAVAGGIDILPMVLRKLDRHSILSAFLFFLVLPFIILNTDLFSMAWWYKGGVIALVLAVPVIILVARDDKKSAVPMAVTSLALGTLIGIAGHLIL